MFWRRSPPKRHGKVVLFGATNAVGQPLSLLLKLCPHVEELVCCRTSLDNPPLSVTGIAADLAGIDTSAIVRFAEDASQWPAALHDAQLVLICAGDTFDTLPTYRDAALQATAPAIRPVMQAIATSGSKAVVAIASNPVNSLTPLCAEWLKQDGAFDPRKLFGVTALDVMRTRKLVAEALDMNPFDVNVPVMGGRGGITACPLIAQTGLRISSEEIVRITSEVQHFGSPFQATSKRDGEDGLSVRSEEEEQSVALGQAQSVLEFAVSVLKAQRGDVGIVECAMVESTMRSEVPFFASRVQLGPSGVDSILPMGKLSRFEHELIEAAVPALVQDVGAALTYARDAAHSRTTA